MARVAGIKTEKYANGSLKSVTFDVKKHGDKINPILEELGVIEDPRLAGKKFYTIEEAKIETIKRFREKCKKAGLL